MYKFGSNQMIIKVAITIKIITTIKQISSFNLATLGEAKHGKLGKQTHRGQTKLRRDFK